MKILTKLTAGFLDILFWYVQLNQSLTLYVCMYVCIYLFIYWERDLES